MKSLRRFSFSRHALGLAVLLSMAACGGGGGGDDDDPDTGTPAATVAVSGVASKGLLNNAVVKAFRVNADGSTTLITQGVTNTDGSYNLTGIPAGQVVVVEISAGANTTMVDEETNTTVAVPSTFRMRAAVVTQEGGANTVQVTPFSEMAVAKAQAATGGLSAGNVEGANADIRTYLGFDVLTEKPEFTGNGQTPANKAALMLAAVSRVAADDTVLGTLGCATNVTTGDAVKCVIDKMAELGSDNDDLAQALGEAKDVVATQDYAGQEVPPSPLPQPETITPPAQGASAVAEAKTLIGNLRNNFNTLGGNGADTLEKRLKAVEAGFNSVPEVLDTSHRGLLQVIVDATGELDDARQGLLTGDLPGGYIFRPSNGDVMQVGCSYFTDAAFSSHATSYETAEYVACRVTHAGIPQNGISVAVQHRVLIAPAGQGYQIRTQVIEQTLQWNGTQWVQSAEAAEPATPYKELAVNVGRDNQGYLSGMSLDGVLAPGVSRDGAVAGHNVGVQLNVSTTESQDGVIRLNLMGQLKSLSGDDAVGTVTIQEGSYLERLPADVGESAYTQAHLLMDAHTATGYKLIGELHLEDWGVDAAGGFAPTKARFTGRIVDGTGATAQNDVELFNGTLVAQLQGLDTYDPALPDSEGNHLGKTLTFDGTLFVPARPSMVIHLALGEPTLGRYTISGSYKQGDITINVSGLGHEDDPSEDHHLTFTSSAGIKLAIKPGQEDAPITKGGVSIGRLNLDEGVIYYRDNTRESF